MYTLQIFRLMDGFLCERLEESTSTSLSRLLKRVEYETIHTREDIGFVINDSTSNPWKMSGVVRPQKLPLKK